MSAFEHTARRILEDLEHTSAFANAYGVEDAGPIYFTDWHYSRKDGDVRGGERTRRQDRVSAAFDAICKGEIEIPAPLSPFFALEPYLAP